jgi:hypothetical protein
LEIKLGSARNYERRSEIPHILGAVIPAVPIVKACGKEATGIRVPEPIRRNGPPFRGLEGRLSEALSKRGLPLRLKAVLRLAVRYGFLTPIL